jgi:hypothetical protein
VGLNAPTNPAPDGAKEFSAGGFLPPHPGLEIFLNDQPTVSPWATFVRHSVAENRLSLPKAAGEGVFAKNKGF